MGGGGNLTQKPIENFFFKNLLNRKSVIYSTTLSIHFVHSCDTETSARDIWDKEKKSIKFHAFSSPELKVCVKKKRKNISKRLIF